MKKILILTAFPPNRLTAGQYHTRSLIDELSVSYQVHVIAFAYKEHPVEVDARVSFELIRQSTFGRLLNCMLNPLVHPFFSSRFSANTLATVKKACLNHDYVYFDFSQVIMYAAEVVHPHKFIRIHDVISQHFERGGLFKRLQLPWIRYSEKRMLRQSGASIMVPTKKDIGLLKHLYDIDAILSADTLKQMMPDDVMEEPDPNVFCLFGAWNRRENSEALLWFLESVYPLLNENVSIKIIGAGMPPNLVAKTESIARVSYTGFVADPLREIFSSAALIAPIREGAGVKVKVLDALCAGTPILGSEMAFEGIDRSLYGDAMIVCNGAPEFANKINHFEGWDKKRKLEFAAYVRGNYQGNGFPSLLKEISNAGSR